MEEFLILESASLREKLCNKKNMEILDKVGQLITVPGTSYTTKDKLLDFYEVSIGTLDSAITRYKNELIKDGYKVLSKKEFENMHQACFHGNIPNRGIAIFPRRGVFRLGMILTGSPVAKAIRNYLLQIEENTKLTQGDLSAIAEKVHQNAIQIHQNSEQSMTQAMLLKAIVSENNKHREEIKILQTETKDNRARINKLESVIQDQKSETISLDQIKILKDIVTQKPQRNITIWKKFNAYFDISRYIHLPKEKFGKAKKWLKEYE